MLLVSLLLHDATPAARLGVGREVRAAARSPSFRCGRPSRQNRPTGRSRRCSRISRTASASATPSSSARSTARVSSAGLGPLQQPQDLDELPRPRPAELGLQPPPQDAEADRQLPARQRGREVQRPGLALQQGQVVDRLVGDLLAAPARRWVAATRSPTTIRTVSTVATTVARWWANSVGTEYSLASKLTSDSESTSRGSTRAATNASAGSGQQRPPLLGEQVGLDGRLAPEPPRQVLAAGPLELGVERLQAAGTAGTGTRKLRRAKPTSVSTCPFSLGRRTRQKWSAKRWWLFSRRNSPGDHRGRGRR